MVASIVMVAVLLQLTSPIADWLVWGWFERSWRLLLVCASGFVVYVLTLLIMGMRPRHFRH